MIARHFPVLFIIIPQLSIIQVFGFEFFFFFVSLFDSIVLHILYYINIVRISESSMDVDVQRQVAESSPNKTSTAFTPGLYAQLQDLCSGTLLVCNKETAMVLRNSQCLTPIFFFNCCGLD